MTEYLFEFKVIREIHATLSIYAQTTKEAFALFDSAKACHEDILHVPGIIMEYEDPPKIFIEHVGSIDKGPSPELPPRRNV